MSHFVRCDRCATEDAVMGTVSLPPGWQTICRADLCESCCQLVHDFIRFTTERAASLPVVPIPARQVSDKLFETAPEEKTNAEHTVLVSADHANSSPAAAATNPATEPNPASLHGAAVRSEHPSGGTDHATPEAIQPPPRAAVDETSAEERVRTRAAKRRKKLLGQDAPPADKRTSFPHGANEVQS